MSGRACSSGSLVRIRVVAERYPDTGETGDAYDIELAGVLENIKARFVKKLQPPARILLTQAGGVE